MPRKKPVLKVENKTEGDCQDGDGERRRRHDVVEALDAHLIVTIRTIQMKMLPLLDLEILSIFVSIPCHRESVDCPGHVILDVTVRAEKRLLPSFNMLIDLFHAVSSVGCRC